MDSKDLRLEVFSSDRVVSACSFHIYNIKTKNIDENPFKIIRGACLKLSNINREIGVFENGHQIITTSKIDNYPTEVDFSLEYVGYKELDVSLNAKVYEKYIEYLIRKKLSLVRVYGKYNKYSCKSDITSAWFKNSRGDIGIYKSGDKSISLERVFNISVQICEDGKAYLWIDTKSGFRSQLTVMDMLARKIDVLGLMVKNDWGSFRQTGILTEIST